MPTRGSIIRAWRGHGFPPSMDRLTQAYPSERSGGPAAASGHGTSGTAAIDKTSGLCSDSHSTDGSVGTPGGPMPEMMRAAVYRGPRDSRVEEAPRPRCGARDVVIGVRLCGICGSDVHSYKAGFYVEPGQILGHEFAGELVEVGDEVADLRPGERVTGFSIGVCGECYWCRREQYTFCPELFRRSTGYGRPGGLA